MSSIRRTLERGVLRDVALTCLAVFFIGLSYGAVAVASGFPFWVPAAQSVFVLAGASEFLFIGIVAAAGSPVAAALVGTHVMNDESVVFALAQDDLPRQRAAYWACGLGVLICWPGGAVLGALIGSAVHDTNSFGLDAMFPAVILALIVPDLRDRMTLRAALAGAAIALVVTPFLPAGLPVLLALAAVLLLVLAPDATREPGQETDEQPVPAPPRAAPPATATAPPGRSR